MRSLQIILCIQVLNLFVDEYLAGCVQNFHSSVTCDYFEELDHAPDKSTVRKVIAGLNQNKSLCETPILSEFSFLVELRIANANSPIVGENCFKSLSSLENVNIIGSHVDTFNFHSHRAKLRR